MTHPRIRNRAITISRTGVTVHLNTRKKLSSFNGPFLSKGRDKEGYTREAYVTEMLRSAAAADVQTIAAALIAVINSLSSGGERVQLYRAVQNVQSAVDACVDKSTLQNSEGDPVAYKR